MAHSSLALLLSPAAGHGLRPWAPVVLCALLTACGGGTTENVGWNPSSEGSALAAVSGTAGSGTTGSGTTGSGTTGSGTTGSGTTGSGTTGSGTTGSGTTGSGTTGSGTTGSGTTGSGTTGSSGSSTPAAGCSSGTYFFCEDFESLASGAATSTKWNIDTGAGTATIDATHARGSKALHLHTIDNGRAFLLPKNFSPTGNSFFGRMWIWVDAFPIKPDYAHFTMVEASGTGNNEHIRPIGGQYIPVVNNGQVLWGVGADGGPTGDWLNWKPSAPATAAKWTCMEWQMDAADNSIKVWIDGVAQPDLSASTKNHGGNPVDFVFPAFNQIRLGWQLYQGGTTPGQFDVWLDDVALSSERINCGASTGNTDTGSGSGSGTGSGTTTPPSTPVACSGMTLCDDFESPAAGSGPDSSRWKMVPPNCSDNTGKAIIDDTVFHSGGKSIRVDSGANYCGHTFLFTNLVASMGNTVYGRFYIRLKEALGDPHVTFMAMCDSTDSAADGGNCNLSMDGKLQNQNPRDVRLGGQSGIVDWNRQRGDPTVPSLSPSGKALSTALTPNAWHCIEFGIDQSAGSLKTWVDGVSIPGMQIDGTPTPDVDQSWLTNPWKPALKDFKLGWEQYSGAGTTVWYDDVALHTSRIGCGSQ
jgi:hypothetical protein